MSEEEIQLINEMTKTKVNSIMDMLAFIDKLQSENKILKIKLELKNTSLMARQNLELSKRIRELEKEVKDLEDLTDKLHTEHQNEFKYWLSIRKEHNKLKEIEIKEKL